MLEPIFKDQVCPDCKAKLQLVNKVKHCPYCSKDDENCQECQQWRKQYQLQHQSLWYYNSFLQTWLNDYKINGNYILHQCFSYELYCFLQEYIKSGYTLVPIPLDENKLNKRGFNQVTAILAYLQLPYVNLLEKQLVLQIAQGLKNRRERLQTEQPFRICSNEPITKVCLIDDIYTTGRTITYAYQCLQDVGVKKLCSCSFIRAY